MKYSFDSIASLFDNVFSALDTSSSISPVVGTVTGTGTEIGEGSPVPDCLPSGYYPDYFFTYPLAKVKLVSQDRAVADSLVDSPFPWNMSVNKDKGLTVQFAMAGYTKDNLTVTRDNKEITVTVSPTGPEVAEDTICLHQGIKDTRKERTITIAVDTDKFLISSVKVAMADGMLTVHLDACEDTKPVKVEF